MDLALPAPSDTLQTDWPPTRAEALRRIDAFAPRMGRHYAGRRNHDLGPGRRDNVSCLSPYLARRMVAEEEAIAAALTRHPFVAAEKFVQEVLWRSYWKGWLEMRPGVWDAYRDGLARDRAELAGERALARRLALAEEGRTGIDCMDAWARELVETGYLHNHARMWFASIWIFTLGLPWRLGADFFLRHLLDGDAASNTLSWRWVAGLHTRGKHYAARAANIATFTAGRFAGDGRLAERPLPLDDGPPPPARPIRPAPPPRFREPTLVVLTTEDLGLDSQGLPLGEAAGMVTLRLATLRSDAAVAPGIAAFDDGALADATARARAAGAPAALAPLVEPGAEALIAAARSAGARRIATGFAHVGWVRDWWRGAEPALARAGLALDEHRRAWDDAAEPHAGAGFFKLKEKIPQILRLRGLAG